MENDKKHNSNASTGSIPYQITSLRAQIANLQVHLSKTPAPHRLGNKKDFPATRALLKKVARIKRFLAYLSKNDPKAYEELKPKKGA